MQPLVVPRVHPPGRRRRTRRITLEPARDVVVIELLGPEEPTERLAHHVPRVVGELLGNDRLVEFVRLPQPLAEEDVEFLAEGAARDRRVGKTQSRDDALTGSERRSIAPRRLGAGAPEMEGGLPAAIHVVL